MDWFSVVFRVIHIGSAIAWAGGAALFFFYVEPTITKLGPNAEAFVDELLNKRKMPVYFMAVSTAAVIGGLILYVRDAGGVRLWLDSTAGTVFTIGGLSAIVAWIGGNAFIPSTAIRMQAIIVEMKGAGGPPSADALERLHAAERRLRMIGAIDLVLIGIAILCMETARYIG